MNKEHLNNIIKGDFQLTKNDLAEIKALTEEFPFCQIGHVLSAVAHKQHEHMLSEDKIMVAALHTGNRKSLRSLINNNSKKVTPTQVVEEQIPTVALVEEQTPATTTTEVTPPEITPKEVKEEEEEVTVEEKLITEVRRQDTDISKELEETLAELQHQKKENSIHKESTKVFVPKTIVEKESIITTEEIVDDTPSIRQESNKQTQKLSNITSSRLGDEFNETSSNKSGSFTDVMLEYLETLEEQRSNKPSKEDQLSIIDSFIEKDPNISRAKPSTKKTHTDDLAKESVKPKTGFISENLAKINAKQGNISKAIDIYEQLILKFPEKKSYFAEQIDKLK